MWPAALWAQEQAAFVPLPGFVLAQEDGADDAFARIYVPDGETAASWSQMQQHRRLPEHAGDNPIEFLRLVAGDLQAICPDLGFRVGNGRVMGGYPTAVIYGRCPAGADRPEPEFFISVAISGEQALHVVEQTWRGAPSDEEFEEQLRDLFGVQLCQATRNPVPCP